VLEGLKQHRVLQLEAKLKAGSRWEEHDHVFCTSVGTHVRPDRDIQLPFKKLLKKAGLPKSAFHDLRYSAATLSQF
jgi:integrase